MADDAGILKIKNVRITWPSIYEKEVFDGTETRYKVSLLIKKDDPQMKVIGDTILKLLKDKKEKVPQEFWCTKDGDESKYDSEDGHWLVTVGDKSQPILLDENGKMNTADDGTFYSGCYVTALISFWVNKKGQKRVVGSLHALQKTGDGERLSAGISKSTALEMLLGESGAKAAMESTATEVDPFQGGAKPDTDGLTETENPF